MDNGELNAAWGKMQANAPCIILLEDIDAVFHGRLNIANKVLTFDCLLNCVDGIERANGVLLVVTTNHMEQVDSALGGPNGIDEEAKSDMPERPGRVDRVVHFAELDNEGRLKMARRILTDCLDQVEVQATLGQADTAAQFQERCFRVALQYKFENPKVSKNGHHKYSHPSVFEVDLVKGEEP
jgi:SpoVK/Ycf46/Vps4 family AAA+-type ATPase